MSPSRSDATATMWEQYHHEPPSEEGSFKVCLPMCPADRGSPEGVQIDCLCPTVLLLPSPCLALPLLTWWALLDASRPERAAATCAVVLR